MVMVMTVNHTVLRIYNRKGFEVWHATIVEWLVVRKMAAENEILYIELLELRGMSQPLKLIGVSFSFRISWLQVLTIGNCHG